MAYADATRVKTILTATGTKIDDSKVLQYCLMADNHINIDLTNVEITVPLPSPPVIVVDIAIALACAYFYKFESGDTITAEQSEKDWDDYFQAKYRRPKFVINNTLL